MTALALCEIVRCVFENLSDVSDLLACACVDKVWNEEALRILYRGSLTDKQFRSPDIESLNCLLVASRERFAFNMSFVKHLLLHPDAPSNDEIAHPTRRIACFQKCRALRRRQDAELMFASHRTCLSSLTIPFEIMGEDFYQVADLLLQTTIKFLAIDISYCGLLADCLGPQRGPSSPMETFGNLRALAVYYPENDEDIDDLCELLANCSLKFLHLENQFTTHQATGAIPDNLRLSLKEQTALEVLALKGQHCDILESSDNSNHTSSDDETAWPLLKALYLRTCNPLRLKQLLKFKYVQAIAVEQAEPNAGRITPEAAGYIGMCRELRAIDLEEHEIGGAEVMRIARGCPKLKCLRLGGILDTESSTFVKDTFLPMIRSLSYLEVLEIRSKFRMDGAVLEELACYCPRLTFLELPSARVDISLTTLYRISPLSHLTGLQLYAVWFERPKHLLQTEELERLAVEWRRVFPKLPVIPCHGDIYWRKDDADRDEEMSDEDMVYQKPPPDFNDYGSSWFILRVKLWKILNYATDTFLLDKMKNVWKRKFEVELIGWPVVPFTAFVDPNLHSTSSREYD